MLRIGPAGDDATRWEHIALWGQQIRAGERSGPRVAPPKDAVDEAAVTAPFVEDAAIEDELSISDALRARDDGRRRVGRDMQDGLALLDVADSASTDCVSVLDRIRVLAKEAAAGVYPPEHRAAIQTAVDYSLAELAAIGERIAYNGLTLRDLAGDASPAPPAKPEEVAPGSADADPGHVTRPARVAHVRGVSVMVSGSRSGVAVESWTGHPAGGIYTATMGEVRDVLGRPVGSYSADGRTVTFDTDTSVTFTSSIAATTLTGRATFTLTPEIEWRDVGPSTAPATEPEIPQERPRADVPPPHEPAGSSSRSDAQLSVLTQEESSATVARVEAALVSLVRLRTDMGVAAQAVLHQDEVALTPETTLSSVLARLKQTDLTAEAVAASRYDLVREFGRTLIGLVAVAHRDAAASLSR